MGYEILETLIYGLFGIICMFAATFLIDLVVPYDFPKEIKEKNPAAGFMLAGIYISVAIIIRTVIM
ncbi:DUF350 domain-containing protein [Acetivibrio cellulolyticus]|uniref:DUF350 domain-containing protein n=1 Tax=Acetivibrio cellulolyticus TaxID=35830 RepID=UPI0001E3014B|nr:DUF350 domain-containing protein [Acetivibrio cellulolyticus]